MIFLISFTSIQHICALGISLSLLHLLYIPESFTCHKKMNVNIVVREARYFLIDIVQ